MSETLLVISAMGVPPYAARGLTQTLEPIEAAVQLRRTVNGDLVDVSAPQLRKYRSTISCADQLAPALNGVWPGMEVVVQCVAELAYLTATGTPERPEVEIAPSEYASRVEGIFTYYRPELTMMVTGFRQQTDEYGAVVSWTLELEEA